MRPCSSARRFVGALAFLLLTSHVVYAQDQKLATWRTDAGVMLPLYSSFVGLQVLDVHSTARAIRAGAVEKNAMMSGLAGRPAALVLMKAGMAAGMIYLVDAKVRKRNRVVAMATMTGAAAAYAIIFAHNYRAVR